MKLERFFIVVPAEVVEDFMRDMQEDIRTAPDLAAAIIVKHYRRMRRLKLEQRFPQQQPEDAKIPFYGPKPIVPEEKANERSTGEV